MSAKPYYDNDEQIVGGRVVEITLDHDDYMRPPWEEYDGSGPVSDWRPRDTKRPGEMILPSDRSSHRFYDFEEATKIAKRDGWGLGIHEFMGLMCKLRRVPTRKQVAREAVRRDYERLRGWCNDDWSWVVVTVTDVETRVSTCCGGFESTDDQGINEYVENAVEEMMLDIIEATLQAA
jgi:hypothetical protein